MNETRVKSNKTRKGIKFKSGGEMKGKIIYVRELEFVER